MFLLDAQLSGGTVDLLFRINKDKIGVWKIPKYNYILSRCDDPEHAKSGRDTVEGIIYGDSTQTRLQFQKIEVQNSETETMDNMHINCKLCKFYDCGLDLKTKTLFHAGIQLYKFYNYNGNPYIDINEYEILDPSRLSVIKDHKYAPKWTTSLTRLTVHLKLSSAGEYGPIIPNIDGLLPKATGWTKEALEMIYGYTLIDSISTFDGCKLVTFTRNEIDTDLKIITDFLSYIKTIDPDILMMYNTSQFLFLHQRCKHLQLEELFLKSVNRHASFKGFGVRDLSYKSITPYFNYDYRIHNTTEILNYSEYSKDTIKNIRPKLIGRILFNYFSTCQKKDVFGKDPNQLAYWHPIFTNSLSVVLSATGAYHMGIELFSAKTIMTQWIIKKEYPGLVYASKYIERQTKKRTVTDSTKDEKIKLKGGVVWNRNVSEGYWTKDGYEIVMVDATAFYPTIIVECNLDLTTIVSDDVIIDDDEVASYWEMTYEICGKRVYKPDHKIGILPSVLGRLLRERSDVKNLLKNPDLDESDRDVLNVQNRTLKEICAIAYGCLGGQWDSNLVSAPIVSEMITRIGRDIWNLLVTFLQSRDHQVIQGTTDGVMLYTKNAKGLKDDLKDFVKSCKYPCIPEVRETYKAVFLKDSQNWIGLDCDAKLVNKGLIRSQNPQIQINIEKIVYKLMLGAPPSTENPRRILEELQNVLLIWSTVIDPTKLENYFRYYHSKNRKNKVHFSAVRYSQNIREFLHMVLKEAHPEKLLSLHTKTQLETIMMDYMPI